MDGQTADLTGGHAEFQILNRAAGNNMFRPIHYAACSDSGKFVKFHVFRYFSAYLVRNKNSRHHEPSFPLSGAMRKKEIVGARSTKITDINILPKYTGRKEDITIHGGKISMIFLTAVIRNDMR